MVRERPFGNFVAESPATPVTVKWANAPINQSRRLGALAHPSGPLVYTLQRCSILLGQIHREKPTALATPSSSNEPEVLSKFRRISHLGDTDREMKPSRDLL
ncbi:uncharacterized protein N7484_001271 [Penicillium longicatenatum]|uniref:uncharacterized protein n=1 Tax=Penicillium longicatenatum TaxID=1561947 RepID=UPI002548E831|nr:uncharacterized protein N7484_001271 [Penicillium longicatenatum]KAJ5657622.1 hypothetical protein N7484_001271 [Penicillium longicatenatum]